MNETNNYLSPSVEVIEIEIEDAVLANSPTGSVIPSMGDDTAW